MPSFSPTRLNVLNENCPYALKLYQEDRDKRPDDDDPEAAEVAGPEAAEFGIVAHACLHAAALAEKEGKPRNEAVEATALVLTRKYSPKIVRAAADHALEFMFEWTFFKEYDYEHGVAFDEKWQETPWDDPKRQFRLIFDVVGKTTFEDEEFGEVTIACAQDYKTGFGAGPEDLDGIQSLAFTRTLRRLYPDVDGIRVTFIATRWKGQYERTWIFDREEDAADLDRRDARLDFYINAAKNADGKPRPGYGCCRCRYTQRCPAFKSVLKDAVIGKAIANTQQAAEAMVVLETRAKELKAALQEILKDANPIQVGSRAIGYHTSEKRVPVEPGKIVDLWFKIAGFNDEAGAAEITHGLIEAADLGVTNIDEVLNKIAKARKITQKAAKEEYGPQFFRKVESREFAWKKVAESH